MEGQGDKEPRPSRIRLMHVRRCEDRDSGCITEDTHSPARHPGHMVYSDHPPVQLPGSNQHWSTSPHSLPERRRTHRKRTEIRFRIGRTLCIDHEDYERSPLFSILFLGKARRTPYPNKVLADRRCAKRAFQSRLCPGSGCVSRRATGSAIARTIRPATGPASRRVSRRVSGSVCWSANDPSPADLAVPQSSGIGRTRRSARWSVQCPGKAPCEVHPLECHLARQYPATPWARAQTPTSIRSRGPRRRAFAPCACGVRRRGVRRFCR